MDITSSKALNNGVPMPRLGLGTWQAGNSEAQQATAWALEIGYRHIDTATIYNNEEGVGRAIADSGVPRGDIFVTTKLWNDAQRAGNAREAFNESMDRLGLGYVDLYLLHWPVAGKFVQSWRVFEELYNEGRCKAIGVSNFLPHHLDELMAEADIKPMVNQFELHPRLQSPGLVACCDQHDIAVEAWSPILKGKCDEVPELVEIANAHGKTATQVAIRWHLQHDWIVIPKSAYRERIEANADVFNFNLTDDQMKTIDALDRNERLGPHPDEFTF